MIVHPTVGPSDLTTSTAARVVACSRTIRRLGKVWWSLMRWGRKVGSAFRMCVFWGRNYLCRSDMEMGFDGDLRWSDRKEPRHAD